MLNLFKVNILLLTFLFFCTTNESVATETEIIQHLTTIVNVSFKRKYCIYFYSNETNQWLEKVLATSNIVIVNPQTLQDSIESKKLHLLCTPDGYIISTKTTKLFANNFQPNIFHPHRKIILFIQDIDKSSNNLFHFKDKQDLDIIIIQIISNSASKYQTIFHLIAAHDIFVYSVSLKKYIFQRPVKAKLNLNEFDAIKWNPQNKKLRLSVFHYPPYVVFNTSDAYFGGVEASILITTFKGWNIQLISHPKFSWKAGIYDILENKADIAAGGQWHLMVYTHNLEMSYPFAIACSTVIVPRPKFRSPESFVYQPLNLNMWMQIISVIVLVSLGLQLVAKLSGDSSNGLFIFNVISILVISPLNKKYIQKGINLILIIWALVCPLVNTIYSAGLASVIAAPRLQQGINRFEDIVETDKLHCYSAGGIFPHFLSDSYHESTKNLAPKIVIPNNDDDLPIEACYLTEYLSDKVLFTELKLNKTVMYNKKLIRGCLGTFLVIFPLQQNSPIKHMLDKSIKRYQEHGLIKAWFSFTMQRNILNVRAIPYYLAENWPKRKAKAIFLKQYQDLFILLFTGYLISFVVFCIELYIFKYKTVV